MPNWASNSMTITDATPEQIQRVVAAVERETLMEEFWPEPDWRQIPNDDGVLPGPNYKNTIRRPGQPTRTYTDNSRFPDGTADQRWYSWRTGHWGVKWDICDADCSVENGVLSVNWNSPWCPPSEEWFSRLSSAMPQAAISCTYQEPGCDFYGITTAAEGEASAQLGSISEIRDEWMRENIKPEQLAIFNDEDHEDYDDTYDEVMEAWWEVEADELDKALAAL